MARGVWGSPAAAAQCARTSSTVGSSIPTTSRIGTRSGSEEPPDVGSSGSSSGASARAVSRARSRSTVFGRTASMRVRWSSRSTVARPEPSRVTYVVHTAGRAWTSSVRATKRTGIVGSASTARSGAVAVPPPLGAVGDDEGDAARPGRSKRALVGGRHRSGPRRRGVGRDEQLRAAAWPRVGQPLDPLPGSGPVGLDADDDVDVGGAVQRRRGEDHGPRRAPRHGTVADDAETALVEQVDDDGHGWEQALRGDDLVGLVDRAGPRARAPASTVGRPARAGGRTHRRARCGAPTASGRSRMARSISSASVGWARRARARSAANRSVTAARNSATAAASALTECSRSRRRLRRSSTQLASIITGDSSPNSM